jgi:phosphopantetheinyl transferase
VYWRVAPGIWYAEVPFSKSIRPPLLSEWESERAAAFNDADKRAMWLAGRALAKTLAKDWLGTKVTVEIREGRAGELVLYRGGLPVPDVWVSAVHRHGRIGVAIADRPIGVDLRRIDANTAPVAASFLTRAERWNLWKVFRDKPLGVACAWAIKEASVRALRSKDPVELRDVTLGQDLAMVARGVRMHAYVVRVLNGSVVAIVGRPMADEPLITRLAIEDTRVDERGVRLDPPVERGTARAKRITDARSRWQQRLRWST